MAEKRMFSLQIIDTDAFLEMPPSTQNLYFHLGMRADDDGFVDNPKKIMKITNSSEDDLKLLLAKRFILGFDSGIIVIKHWKIHNYIAKDRYHETRYLDEKRQLIIKDNNAYTDRIQNVDSDKIRLDKISIDKNRLINMSNFDKEVIDNIYKNYPTKCYFSNRNTGKNQKCKDKIKNLIKSGKDPNELIELIKLYIDDCKQSKTYYKNFLTFLNNLPDKESFNQEPRYKFSVNAEVKT